MKLLTALLIPVLIAFDQASKWLAEARLPLQEVVELVPFFSLYLTYNKGVAFSMLEWLGSTGLVVMTGLIVLLMIYFWWRVPARNTLSTFGFAFVIAGALGNLIDRAVEGHVVDYFLFHTETWSFAVFNVADSFITVGAIMIIFDELFVSGRKTNSNALPTQGE